MVGKFQLVRTVVVSRGVTPARRYKLVRYVLENDLRF
jgi:hypothetical protein